MTGIFAFAQLFAFTILWCRNDFEYCEWIIFSWSTTVYVNWSEFLLLLFWERYIKTSV